MRQDKDRSGKWLLGKHGGSVVKLAGITGFSSWRHLSSEVVAPRRLLDGLIELRFPDDPTPTLVLVEIESYADSTADRQVMDDLLLVAVERGVVPEVVSLVLKPKGNVRVTGTDGLTSRSGNVSVTARWPVVQLWEVDAERLLADPDVGLTPWAPLARSPLPPRELVARCVEKIAAVPDTTDRAGLLAVTEILSGFAFPGFRIVDRFEAQPMIVQEALASEALRPVREQLQRLYGGEAVREAVMGVLRDRFGSTPADVEATLKTVTDAARLRALNRLAATAPDLAAFVAELQSRTE